MCTNCFVIPHMTSNHSYFTQTQFKIHRKLQTLGGKSFLLSLFSLIYLTCPNQMNLLSSFGVSLLTSIFLLFFVAQTFLRSSCAKQIVFSSSSYFLCMFMSLMHVILSLKMLFFFTLFNANQTIGKAYDMSHKKVVSDMPSAQLSDMYALS